MQLLINNYYIMLHNHNTYYNKYYYMNADFERNACIFVIALLDTFY